MQTYYDEHLHQRKSSLSSFSKTKRQPIKTFQQSRNQEVTVNRQSSNQCLKSQQKSISKSSLNENTNTLRADERSSSMKKNNPRLRDQESSDYIRNLYKKYLGKENKQPIDKLSAFTERKLRTTESKQLIANNNNTTAKDMTRRTLFPDTEANQTPTYNHYKKQTMKTPQLQPSHITLMKKDRNKIQSVLSKPNESTFYENNYQKSTHLQNNKTIFQTNKKQPSKKQEKQTFQKQCESKKSNKNYKSKSRIEKQKTQPQQQLMKPTIIKRSQSTQLKSEKNNTFFQSNKKTLKEKQKFMEVSLVNNTQVCKINNAKNIQNNTTIHPHRQSYCQFDTEQQIINNNLNFNKHHVTVNKAYQMIGENRQSTAAQSRSSQNIVCNENKESLNQNLNTKGQVYTRFINDLQTLGTIVGKESSLFLTLQKINRIKNKPKQINVNKYGIKKNEQKQYQFVHKLFI